MGNITTIALGFLGCGGLAAIVYFITSRSGGKSKIMEAVHKVTQKIGQEKLDKLEEKKNKVKMEVEIKEEVADKILLFSAPKLIGAGLGAIGNLGIKKLDKAISLKNIETKKIGRDILVEGRL